VSSLKPDVAANIAAAQLDPDRMPDHIACVMDGNGRWAQDRGLKRTEGHTKGELALFDTLEAARQLGTGWFTVYAFSTENWKRPKAEVKFLINYSRIILDRRREELHERNIRIRVIGRRDWRVPKGVLKRIERAEELTQDNTGTTFTVAFNYGGRTEIVDAVRAIVDSGKTGQKITEKLIAQHLYDAEMPDVDLMVRTSGEQRISNFLLWQLAYAELVFTPTLWPDFGHDALVDVIGQYQGRDRRYGVLS
jgi:undecaprenyl diphosphate synthase